MNKGAHVISIKKKKSDNSNPFLVSIKEKRAATLTKEQQPLFILDKNPKSKLIFSEDKEKHQVVPKYAHSDFFILLVNAYLNDPEYNNYFLTKNNNKISVSDSRDDIILSYTPMSEKADEIIQKAIQCAKILMPYTAKSILYHHNYPNCALEIIVNGSSQYTSLLHLINNNNKNLPNVFNINRSVIEFLCTKVDQLSNSKNLYSISLTGEALSFTLDDTNKESQIDKINISDCNTVFGQSYNDKSRLILLISQNEECPPNEPKLDWISKNLIDEEESIQIASNLVNGISAYHIYDLYILKEINEFKYTVSNSPNNENFQINTNSNLNEVFQILFKKYENDLSQEIPITDLKYIIDDETYKKREKYFKIKEQINELYNTIKKNFNSEEVESKRKRKSILKKDIKNMRNKSNNHPDKKALFKEIDNIDNYLDQYNSLNLNIKKLLERKSRLIEFVPDIGQFEKDLQSKNYIGHNYYIFGCFCFSTKKINSNEEEEILKSNLIKIARDNRIRAISIEKLVTVTIHISHNKGSSLSSEKFKEVIYDVCKKFPLIISYYSDYQPREKETEQIGRISISILYPKFAPIIVSEIKKSLFGEQLHKFRIPKNLASKTMLLDKNNQEIIKSWLRMQNLDSIELNGENWVGDKESIHKAYKLLEKNDTCIQFPQKVILIPPNIKKSEIYKMIENHNKNIDCEKWDLDNFSNCLIVSKKDLEEATEMIKELESKKMPKNLNSLLGCINICDKEIPSELQLTVYNKDGSYDTNNLCTECIMRTLDHIVNCNFEDTIGIDFEALMSSMDKINPLIIWEDTKYEGENIEYWPKVPLGQLLWILVKDTKFSQKAKAWLTGMLFKNLHSKKNVVTFCPEHPYIVLPRPIHEVALRCTIKDCPYFLCSKCNEWHTLDKECSDWVGMRCPQCKIPTEKFDGCNLITCTYCGTTWCYKCGLYFENYNECKDHMITEHGGTLD